VFKNDVPRAIEILADMLTAPKLEDAAIERERQVILRESEEVSQQQVRREWGVRAPALSHTALASPCPPPPLQGGQGVGSAARWSITWGLMAKDKPSAPSYR
jgi:hypothetical protein